MTDLWTVLVPILLTDALNPVLFAFLVFAAGTARPVLNSTSMLAGHTFAYFGAGIAIGIGLEAIVDRLNNPQFIDFVIELAIGLALVALAIPSRNDTGKRPDENTPELNVASSFAYGAFINFIGIPFAVPYFAAVGQIMKSDLSQPQAYLTLAIYNLVYALPFALVPIARAIMGEEARPLLERIKEFIEKVSGMLMPILLSAIGIALIADAITYFVTGASLFPVDLFG
ncbi:MAG: GAP family protein [Gammaproteobacteria bacterium]